MNLKIVVKLQIQNYTEYRMNLIQQFLEENLSRDLNHHILHQIQNQNSAIQTLVDHLEDLRQRDNAQSLSSKIKRIENFIEIKKQLISSLQQLNNKGASLFTWVLNSFVENNFLYELIKRQQFLVQKQLTEIGKKIFLGDGIQVFHEQIDFANKLVKELTMITRDKSQIGKSFNKEKIKEIDYAIQLFQEKISLFQEQVNEFNTEMLIFLKKVYAFDEQIKSSFYLAFNTSQNSQPVSNTMPEELPISPQSIQQPEDDQTAKSSKSHLSMNSKDPSTRLNFTKTERFFKNQQHWQTEKFNPPQNLKPQKSKLILNKRIPVNEDKYQNFTKKQNYENKFTSELGNKKRPSIDYNGLMAKNSQIAYPSEMQNMNRTLSVFNYHRPESNKNLPYATNELGQQVRLPTKYASNTRSAISHYPSHER